MKRFLSIIGLLTAFCLSVANLQAEFLQTSNYFQSSDGTARVIPTNMGIYFLLPKSKIGLQEFSLTQIEEGMDAFLEYDKTANRYSELHIGPKSYRINGSFALVIDEMVIKVDNFANPYCTVELNPKKGNPAILAFQGITAVANYSGRSSVAVLSANQSLENISEIHPYKLSPNGTLNLNENPVRGTSVGIDIQPPESPCLMNYNEIVFLTKNELNAIRANKDDITRKKELSAAIKKNKVNILKELILLKATKEIIALDPRDSSIKSIRLVSSEPKICEITTIDLG